jgi:type II secretory pathway component PulK
MTRKSTSSGVALVMVLWTLAILSAIALTLAASVGTEVRASQDLWNDLQAERLARAGQELALYLDTRSLGTTSEDLADLPVQPVVAGLKYRVAFDIGSVDIALEGENGKFDVSAATEEDLAAFFTSWTGDLTRGREIAASIGDWIDSNDEVRPMGAESASYTGFGYSPRNSGLGAADLFLINGLRSEDFGPSLVNSSTVPTVRGSLAHFLSTTPTGPTLNPNYASAAVLAALPGMTPVVLARLLDERQRSVFRTADEFRQRVGLMSEDPLLRRVTFGRGTNPTVVCVARVHGFSGARAERRTRSQIVDRRRATTVRFVSFIEHSMTVE